MDFGTIKAEIASDLERSLTDDVSASETWDDLIGRQINNSIQLMRSKHWWFLQKPIAAAITSTTTSGDSYVDEPTGLVQLNSLRITITGQLMELEPVDFDTMEMLHDGSQGDNNQPYKYTRWGKRIRLYPTPNDTFTLTWSGLFEEDTLSADDDTNDWCTDGALVLKAQTKLKIYRDVIKDMEGAAAADVELREATMALDREHIRRSATNRIRRRC